MKELKLYQNTTNIKPLKQLQRLIPLITKDRRCLSYPSNLELISLSVDLCYKLHLIINENEKLPKDKSKNNYISKSLELQKILNDYENNNIDMKEFIKIKKEFNIKRLK